MTSAIASRAERTASYTSDRGTSVDADSRGLEQGADGVKNREAARAQFSALLALIAGVGARANADVQAPRPAERTSLVEALLSDTADGPRSAQDVSEALRYGILNISSDQSLTSLQTPLTEPPFMRTDTISAEAGAIPGGTSHGRQRRIEGERNALAVLSRIATKNGASVEQMMAIGDARGADVRVALDALLATAGTPAGADIADDRGAAAAASAMAAAFARASAMDPTTPIKDLDAVAPELRSRVQRVIDRMKGEYGHDVSIVETARSQERQDHLFAQGRSRPGEVVTWTRDSAHTRGDAVDVNIDGSWENAAGFARLQRIAREEGLRTLGMKDPGHLELATPGERSLSGSIPFTTDTAASAERSRASVAPTAVTAGIARVATVASVAPVALAATAAGAAAGAAAGVTAGLGAGGDRQSPDSERGRNSGDERTARSDTDAAHASPQLVSATDRAAVGTLFGEPQLHPLASTNGRTSSVGHTAGSEQASRVAEVQAMRADAPAGPLSRMTLNVDNANGTQDRITVDLRGNVVDTFISTDAASAERLKLRTGELQESLGRHGLDADRVRISGTVRQESTDASRVLGSDRDAMRTNGTAPTMSGENASSHNSRDRATGHDWERQQDARREQKEQAARDQQREQADRRGWQKLFDGSTR